MIQYQYENDEVIGVWIQCNNYNKTVPCPLYKTVTIEILPFVVLVYCGR